MILTCPECSARFAVPDALIPASGRTVKCGRCAHQWHAENPDAPDVDFAALAAAEAAQQEEIARPVKPSQLPVPRVRKPLSSRPFILAALLILVAWLVLAFVAYYPTWLPTPGPRAIYKVFGVRTTEGLAFSDVTMQRNSDGVKTQFLITGSIANQSADIRTVPAVRVELKNEKGKVIWAREYPVNETLDAGSVYPFRIDNVVTTLGPDVASITLDVGTGLQLIMR